VATEQHQMRSERRVKSIIHSINTLWQEQEFELIFSKESLTKKAAEIGKNDLCETSQKGTP